MRVLVYGATGTQGGPVARRALAAGHDVTVLTRDAAHATGLAAAGARVAVGDLADPASLRAASQGADAVFLHLPNVFDLQLGLTWLRSALDAAEAADVRLLVYTTSSLAPEEPTDVALFEIRRRALELLAQSPVSAIALKPTAYLDNLAAPWLQGAIRHQGVLPMGYLPHHQVTWIAADDQAAVAVAALDRPDLAGQVFRIGGADTVTGPELAVHVADAVGRRVQYVPIDPDALQGQLTGQIGAEAAIAVADAYRWHAAHGTHDGVVADPGVVERTFGVRLRALPEVLPEIVGVPAATSATAPSTSGGTA